MNSLLDIKNLRVAYPEKRGKSHWAVNDVSLTLQPGEKLGLVGESGCGKSTLGRAAMRLLPKSVQVEGSITFGGEYIFEMNPSQLRKFRGEAVALVFQDPMTRLDPLMTIGDHCVETIQAHQPNISKSQAQQKSTETLEAVNIPASRWSQYPHEFSGGMRQRVAIALALLLDPKLIVADEPTTSLDVTIASQILGELTRLCQERQTSLLLISHDLAMVGEYCDRIAVMYGGEIVETGSIKQVLYNPQHEYTKSLFQAALHIQVVESTPAQIQLEKSESTELPKILKPILQIKNLQKHYTLESNFIEQLLFSGKSKLIKAVDGVNLDLYPGEIVGLVGESGCGKSTLSRTILQLIKSTSGSVEFQGKDLTSLSLSALQPYRREMQMIFQDPLACLNPMMTVDQIIADPLFIHNLASVEKAKIQVEQMLEKVGLTPVAEYGKRYPSELSGGQQQRVAIARALITNPKLIICDEPVSMLDATIQTQVLELMLELKKQLNLTYLFITHDLWVARFICDRIAVMNSGKIVEEGKTEEIFNYPQHPYTQTLLNAAPLLS
ncbi:MULTISPECIES: ABC transporter ATP-binding protein [Okeania]|uniref:ABC transporter ATP-binding protein n=2 Tax=Okeania TaxID=1458928 RepID=A0A3N6NZM1_9CYAN|nr:MULTISPECIES: ABC transporter ATP-binding protein [Okeania]NET15881.1 ABC transporter ATP-binding protein [Okeania sp. SIO1H6]NES78454.1 ABC transporter ATP-binding protein [Okeania sp. SIO1H4]NET21755.1 ABC transporter ATP-binding protein [Okeania sp. SIO1H5]NET78439.1 ABC transporter ATP-binding protein [Okeania sp. SIO1F9]NET96727.1 ABC transporter ATP-binding protein [Okeania sp. SIO1H2]